MIGTTVTVVGNVASDIRYSKTRAGIPVAEFRVAASERHYHRGRQAWVDGATSFYAVRAYRGTADNVASSVEKGDPVVLTGWLRVIDRRRGDGPSRYYQAEIDVLSVGHDLTKGTSAFRRTGRKQRAGGGPAGEEGGDGWRTGLPGGTPAVSSEDADEALGGESDGEGEGGGEGGCEGGCEGG